MANLAFKPANIVLDPNTYETQVGNFYINGNEESLANPNLSWVPTPTEEIYYIGYPAATDNLSGSPLVGDDVYKFILDGAGSVDTFNDYSATLQSSDWWGDENYAATVAENYGSAGYGVTIYVAWNLVDGNTKVATKYWDSVEEVTKSTNLRADLSIYGNYGGAWALVEPYQVTYQSKRSGSTEPDAGVQFLGTIDKTDEAFISLVTYIAISNGYDPDGIVDASSARNFLNSLQYYTNYPISLEGNPSELPPGDILEILPE